MHELKHFTEFQTALENYQPSAAAKEALKHLKLVVLVAPTSAGRNTIIDALVKTGDYHFIISDTTRAPRANNGVLEKNGSIYWFRTEEEVLKDVQEGKFLEAEIIHNQQVSGVSIRELEAASAENKVAITDMDIGGVRNVLRAKGDTIAIMVLPPSFDEWQRRINSRGIMSKEELIRRLQTARRIFDRAQDSKRVIFVINDSLEHAIEKVQKIVHTGVIDDAEQDRARALDKELLKDTDAFLDSATSTLD